MGSGAPVGGPWAAPIDLRGRVPDSGECPADFCVSDWCRRVPQQLALPELPGSGRSRLDLDLQFWVRLNVVPECRQSALVCHFCVYSTQVSSAGGLPSQRNLHSKSRRDVDPGSRR